MKKCARCDHEYEDAYDGCPFCARPQPTPRTEPNTVVGKWTGGELFWVLLGLVCLGFGLMSYNYDGNAVYALEWFGIGVLVSLPGQLHRAARESKARDLERASGPPPE
jgi:hypothetical protein